MSRFCLYLRENNDVILHNGEFFPLISFDNYYQIIAQRVAQPSETHHENSKPQICLNSRESTDLPGIENLQLENISLYLLPNITFRKFALTHTRITLPNPLFGSYMFLPSKNDYKDREIYLSPAFYTLQGEAFIHIPIYNISPISKTTPRRFYIGTLQRLNSQTINNIYMDDYDDEDETESSDDSDSDYSPENFIQNQAQLNVNILTTVLSDNEPLHEETDLSLFQKNLDHTDDVTKLINKSELTEYQYNKLCALVNKYKSIFWTPNKKLSATNKMTASIDTGDAGPVTVKPYRPPPALLPPLKKELEDLLSQDIIKKIDHSPYNAPCILLKKQKNGVTKYRLVIDYRELNKTIKPMTVPFPDVFHSIDKAANTARFSSVDLVKAFHQLLLNPEDMLKTSFSTPFGNFCYARLPFGLSISPLIFQQLIDKVLTATTDDFTSVFLDDILVMSKHDEKKSEEELDDDHIKKLETVFSLLQDANLSIRIDKCAFFRKSVKYLGFQLTQHGYYPDDEKINVIKNYPRPTTRRMCKTFLGICSFFRRHSPKYSETASPLTKLTSVKVPFIWTEECESAFIKLKAQLCQQALLSFPLNNGNPYLVFCDASDKAIGCVLAQEQNNKLVPLNFASRCLSPTESRYACWRREVTAILYAVNSFKYYLVGQRFKLFSDHKPLRYIFTTKNIRSVYERYRLLLSEYTFEICYIPGPENTAADALSRILVKDGQITNLPDERTDKAKTYEEFVSEWERNQKQVSIPIVPSKAELKKLQQKSSPSLSIKNNTVEPSPSEQNIQTLCPSDLHFSSPLLKQEAESSSPIQRIIHIISRYFPLCSLINQFSSDFIPTSLFCQYEQQLSNFIEELDNITNFSDPFVRYFRKRAVEHIISTSSYLDSLYNNSPKCSSESSLKIHKINKNISTPKTQNIQPPFLPNYLKSDKIKTDIVSTLLKPSEHIVDRSKILEMQIADEFYKLQLKQRSKNILNDTKYLLDDDGVLFKKNKQGHPCIYIPPSLDVDIITRIHSSPFFAHAGFHRLYDYLKQNVYITKLATKIRNVLNTCENCNQNKPNTNPIRAELQLYNFKTQPMNFLSIDHFGPIHSTNDPLKLKYGFVIVDRLTHWIEVYALPDLTTESTLKAFVENFIPVHGTPEKIASDRGSSFTAEQFEQFCQSLDIITHKTTAYRPQSNGLAEASVKRTKAALMSLVTDYPSIPWYHLLPYALISIRSTVNAATKYSPFELLYGRQMRLPLTSQLQYSQYTLDPDTHNYRMALWKTVLEKAATNIESYQQKYQIRENKKAHPKTVSIGQRVYLKKMQFSRKQSKLFQRKYDGPFIVTAVSGTTITIRHLKNKKLQRVHIDRLKVIPLPKSPNTTISPDTKLIISSKNSDDKSPDVPLSSKSKTDSNPKMTPSHSYNTRSRSLSH